VGEEKAIKEYITTVSGMDNSIAITKKLEAEEGRRKKKKKCAIIIIKKMMHEDA
jgi:hypothetical protein